MGTRKNPTISKKERARRAKQARKNFGHTSSRKSKPKKKSKSKGRKTSRKKSSGGKGVMGFGIKNIPSPVKKAATGIGLAAIAGLLAARFAPTQAKNIKLAASYIGGGFEGILGQILTGGGMQSQAAPSQDLISSEELV